MFSRHSEICVRSSASIHRGGVLMITSIKDFAGEVIVMSRTLKVSKNTGFSLSAITALLVLSLAPRAYAEPAGTAGGEPRTSVSSHRMGEGREGSEKLVDTVEEYDDLVTSGERNNSDTRGKFAKPGSGATESQSASFARQVHALGGGRSSCSTTVTMTAISTASICYSMSIRSTRPRISTPFFT